MRCDCCDAELNEVDISAKFADGRFVNMCKECRSFLPSDIKVTARERPKKEQIVNPDTYDLTDWEKMNLRAEDWDDS